MAMNRKQKWQIGLLAWLCTLSAILDTYFHILDPAGSQLWILYGFGLLFGLASAGAMDVEFNIRWEGKQMQVLTFGVMGGAALIMLQVLMGVFDMLFAATPAPTEQLTILAAVSEELMFTMVLFGSLLIVAEHFRLHWLWAAVPSSVIFALFHFFAYGLQWYGIVLLTIGGVILRWSYMKTKDIGTPMIAHMINNGIIMGTLAVFEAIMDYWWLIAILGVLLLLPSLILKRR